MKLTAIELFKYLCSQVNSEIQMARDPVRRKPFIIGVAGGTASGKSLVTAKIFERLAATETSKQVVTLSLESFYRDLTLEEQKKVWTGDYDFDHPGFFLA